MFKLNDIQMKAVKNKDQNHLVVASAGSGKTGVLTQRVAHLLNKGESNILLLTFTVKAADEMLRRVMESAEVRVDRHVTSGTFHGFAHKILRLYAKELGYAPNFTVLDSSDSVELMKMVGIGSEYSARNLMDIHSSNVNTTIGMKAVIKEKIPNANGKQVRGIINACNAYDEYKKRHSIMDFDDLLLNLVRLLEIKDMRKRVSRYDHILVDEFQDCNHLQIGAVRLLSKRKGSKVFVVGDINQSIYGWRGANYTYLRDFPKEFNATFTVLEQNYRSAQPILDLANEVAKGFEDCFKIKMFSTIKGDKPKYIRPESEEDQANKVASGIKEMIDSGVSPSSIAVLYRVNSSADKVETEFRTWGIPYTRKGGQSLFEMGHIKDIIALLKLSMFKMDTVSWARALDALPGIGRVAGDKALDAIKDRGWKGLADFKGTKNWDSISILYKAVQTIKANNKNTGVAIKAAIDYWKPFFGKKYGNVSERESSIESFSSIASKFSSVKKFIMDVTLAATKEEDEKNCVTLSSIHSAKGLEWNTVYIINVVEGKIPAKYFIQDKNGDEKTDRLEEERRLFYVALTRAKRNLLLYAPLSESELVQLQSTGDIEDSDESRYIKEIKHLDNFVDIKIAKKKNFKKRYFSQLKRAMGE